MTRSQCQNTQVYILHATEAAFNLIREGLVWLQDFISTKQDAHLIRDQDELIQQVEAGVTPGWLERKPRATSALCGED